MVKKESVKEVDVVSVREQFSKDSVLSAVGSQDLFNIEPQPLMPQSNPATQALFELTNLDKIKLMTQTDDPEICRIVSALGLGRALELVGCDVMEDLIFLTDEKFQMRVSNKRLGRAEQIEGVRSESGSSAPVVNFGDSIRDHFTDAKVIKKDR